MEKIHLFKTLFIFINLMLHGQSTNFLAKLRFTEYCTYYGYPT